GITRSFGAFFFLLFAICFLLPSPNIDGFAFSGRFPCRHYISEKKRRLARRRNNKIVFISPCGSFGRGQISWPKLYRCMSVFCRPHCGRPASVLC
ncbi:MAG: hypothetical protein IJC54_07800, partial [Clostridia bacterium]|nr:hypothetical protein [Clostridia bacterium]